MLPLADSRHEAPPHMCPATPTRLFVSTEQCWATRSSAVGSAFLMSAFPPCRSLRRCPSKRKAMRTAQPLQSSLKARALPVAARRSERAPTDEDGMEEAEVLFKQATLLPACASSLLTYDTRCRLIFPLQHAFPKHQLLPHQNCYVSFAPVPTHKHCPISIKQKPH
jgi:hypothetical protein